MLIYSLARVIVFFGRGLRGLVRGRRADNIRSHILRDEVPVEQLLIKVLAAVFSLYLFEFVLFHLKKYEVVSNFQDAYLFWKLKNWIA